MCNAKPFAREAFEEVAGDRFAWRKTNAVHKTVKFRPCLGEVCEHAFDLLVAGHVAVKNQLRVKLGGKVGDAVFEALAHIAEREFSALLVAGTGDAVGDGAVGQYARDEQLLAGQKTHVCSPVECGISADHRPRGVHPAACAKMLPT